jgi:ligand-binding sensor domain-containing protein
MKYSSYLLLTLLVAGCADEGDVLPEARDSWTYYKKTQGLVSDEIQSLYEDADGNIWVGTFGGVSRYDGKTFSNFTVTSTQGGLLSNSVHAILETSFDEVWFGTSKGLAFLADNKWTNLPTISGFTYSVNALWQDENNVVWIGTSNLGLLWFDGKNLFQYFDSNCNACNEITVLFEDSKHNLWIGTTGALKQLPSSNTTASMKVFTRTNGLSGNYITSITEDAWGNIWVGTFDGETISRYANGKFESVSLANSYVQNWVTGMTADGEGNLWIATGIAGIYRYDGAVMRKELTHVPENFLGPMLNDTGGDIWIGTYSKGIIRYTPR